MGNVNRLSAVARTGQRQGLPRHVGSPAQGRQGLERLYRRPGEERSLQVVAERCQHRTGRIDGDHRHGMDGLDEAAADDADDHSPVSSSPGSANPSR